MASGRDLSVSFIEEHLLPLLREKRPGAVDRVAVAVIGTGSDVSGLDDDISRDHHWGPRANVMIHGADGESLREDLRGLLGEHLPERYEGYPVVHDVVIMTGVCVTTVDQFFGYFLGTAALPQSELDWLRLCEVDLLHVTSGVVVHDGPGELSRRRNALAYYPDGVWRKRMADWCMYITGRDAPYNLNRVARRGDETTAMIYKALYIKQVMELVFMLNRRYAPYTKWLNRVFRTLPRFSDEVAPMLDEIRDERDLRTNVFQMIEVNYVLAEAFHALGLTAKPVRSKFDEGLTDLTLYDSAAQIYRDVPKEVLAGSFNRTELWERLARDVLFDTNDYFLRRGSHAEAPAS